MRICFANENYSMGGAQRVTYDLGQCMAKENDVYYYSLSEKDSFFGHEIIKSKPNDFLSKCLRYSKIEFFKKMNLEYNPRVAWSKNIADLISFLDIKNIDVVVLGAGLMTSFAPEIKKKNSKVKIISWQHSEANTYLNIYYKNILSEYKHGLECSDAVVCLTPHDKEIFQSINKNSYNINNVVNLSSKTIDMNKEKKEGIRIGFCSRYHIETKGLDLLAEIIKKLPIEYKVYFAGDGTDDEVKALNKIITDNNIEKQIVLLGALSEEELSDFYSSLDVFISTSRWEGFGLSIVEAMSCGVPVISFKNSGPMMILDDGKYGILIEKYNVEKFSDEIINLIGNPNKVKQLSMKSIKRSEDFSSHIVCENWKHLIKKI